MCLFKLFKKKKELSELEEYENRNKVNYYDNISSYEEKNLEPCFVTIGDIFLIGDNLVILGVALNEIKLGDKLVVGTETVIVRKLEVYRESVEVLKTGENGAIGIKNNPKLKKYILDLALSQSENNKPINISGKPTTKYAFYYKK